ncbi:hypothetical protein DSO57_1002406 [Entomophthora muscae]|uniref:Uncharacterized protein n=1 Tax=Entomophthora muscae TaxID=34485 RepID=A0ACC2SAS7_9FUNG|nr:hypothetical protein DSO57_1002406 [Entomophthora muscae]
MTHYHRHSATCLPFRSNLEVNYRSPKASGTSLTSFGAKSNRTGLPPPPINLWAPNRRNYPGPPRGCPGKPGSTRAKGSNPTDPIIAGPEPLEESG